MLRLKSLVLTTRLDVDMSIWRDEKGVLHLSHWLDYADAWQEDKTFAYAEMSDVDAAKNLLNWRTSPEVGELADELTVAQLARLLSRLARCS